MKTLHLTNAYHPASGGIRTVYRTLMHAANTLGRPIRLVVPGQRDHVESVGPHAKVYVVAAPRAFAVDTRYRLIMPTKYLLPWVNGIRQILREEQPDVVEVCDKHSLCYVAGLLKKGWIPGVRRPTLVATSAERFDDAVSTFLSPGRGGRAFAQWFMRAIYAPMFDYHLANSPYTAQELLAALPEAHRHVVHITPPSLSNDAFRVPDRDDTREALLGLTGGDRRTRLLVYVGRLSREKNLTLLVDMLERLIGQETAGGDVFHLLVAGDGPERPMLEAARARLGHRLHLLGNLPGGSAVRRLLASADLFVHPNPREPFGLAPLEAMAVGLPVLVPDRGGVTSYADDRTAWLASPSPSAFAAAAQSAFRQPAVTRARVEAALARAAEFGEGVVVPKFFALLEELHEQRLSGQAATVPVVPGTTIAGEAATSR